MDAYYNKPSKIYNWGYPIEVVDENFYSLEKTEKQKERRRNSF